jgi:AcrR family transcriptional regulator
MSVKAQNSPICTGNSKMEKRKKESDRRVQRTQRLLREALVELIIEKGYDAVTVQDIIDRADVGRSTFYTHFWDKDALLLSGFEKLREQFELDYKDKLVGHESLKEQGIRLGQLVFQHAEGHHQLYKALVGKRGGELITKFLQKFLADMLQNHLALLPADHISSNIPREVTAQFLAGALLALLTWWLDNDLPYPAEDMSRMFQHLAFRTLGLQN